MQFLERLSFISEKEVIGVSVISLGLIYLLAYFNARRHNKVMQKVGDQKDCRNKKES